MNDLERQLTEWADAPVDAPDSAFADRLDAALRVQAADRTRVRPARPLWQPVVLTAVLLLVVASSVFALAGRPSSEEVDAVDPSPAPTAAVTTTEAVVDTTVEPSTTQTAPTTTTADATATSLGQNTDTTGGGDTTITIDGRSTTTGATDARPTTTATDRPTTTSGSSPTDGQPVTSTTTVPTVTLMVAAQRATVVLSWTYDGPATLAGWEVIVTNGTRTSTVAVLRDPSARSFTAVRLDDPVVYRVVALTGDGAVIAQSADVPVS